MTQPEQEPDKVRLVEDHPNAADSVVIRRVVANNPNTPIPILNRLSGDKDQLVRRYVAENPRTPEFVLQILIADVSPEVRLALAENPNTPPALLADLAQDIDADVRYGVAENPHIPVFILKFLSRDDNPYIRCRALKTLRMTNSQESILMQELFEHVNEIHQQQQFGLDI